MKHADWCRSRQPQGFCNCKPSADPREVWHNATLDEICKAVVPGYKEVGK